MTTIIFFRRILVLSGSPSITLNDLTATMVSYFDINLEFAERESERIVESICNNFSMLLTFKASVLFILLVNLPSSPTFPIAQRVLRSLRFVPLSMRSTLIGLFCRKSSRLNLHWGFHRHLFTFHYSYTTTPFYIHVSVF